MRARFSKIGMFFRVFLFLAVIVGIALPMGLAAPAQTAQAAEATTWYEQFTGSTNAAAGVYYQNWRCQTFTPQTAHYLNTVSFYLYKVGSPNYTVTISLQPTLNHKPTGEILSSTTLGASSLTTTAAWYTYTFATGYNVQAGVEYALVLSAISGTNTSYVAWGRNTSGGYSGGMRVYTVTGGTAWITTTEDHAFMEGQL